MNYFPLADPIPLPAPVWLFKALHMVTLSLHFVAVEMLLGGLLIAIVLNLTGAGRPGHKAVLRMNAAAALARRLPILMTFVINLGVPPLLFAQVLYGQALYTSSVLIGAYWISVIVLLTVCYWLLYQFAADAEKGKAGWWKGLLAWVLAGSIAKIYVTNMTLMIRPDVWADMYAKTAHGTQLPPTDPTLLPRWAFMLVGGLAVAGLWMLWISGRKSLEAPVKQYLYNLGGRLALLAVLVVGLGYMILSAQSLAVQSALARHSLYHMAWVGWMVMAVLVALTGAMTGFGRNVNGLFVWAGPALGVLMMSCWAIFRDGIRDLTLLEVFKFDVWKSVVVTNWGVVIIFLASFVIGLAVVAWLVYVVARAKTVTEKVNA